MTPEILRYRIPSERAGAFVQAYESAAVLLQRSPNCLGYALLHSVKDPELWLLTIRWNSAEGHLQGFRKSALFAEFLALVRPFIENLLEMEHYETTDLEWRRA